MESVSPGPPPKPLKNRIRPYKQHVFVCFSGKTCPTKGSCELVGTLRERLALKGLAQEIRVTKSGCLDLCDAGPTVVVYPQGVWYAGVQLSDLEEIVESHLIGGKPVERLVAHSLPQ
jgi:(2Fe-2S) ferredoxin